MGVDRQSVMRTMDSRLERAPVAAAIQVLKREFRLRTYTIPDFQRPVE